VRSSSAVDGRTDGRTIGLFANILSSSIKRRAVTDDAGSHVSRTASALLPDNIRALPRAEGKASRAVEQVQSEGVEQPRSEASEPYKPAEPPAATEEPRLFRPNGKPGTVIQR
jgi:hypothetical protein